VRCAVLHCWQRRTLLWQAFEASVQEQSGPTSQTHGTTVSEPSQPKGQCRGHQAALCLQVQHLCSVTSVLAAHSGL
jgi:hypothetical protein